MIDGPHVNAKKAGRAHDSERAFATSQIKTPTPDVCFIWKIVRATFMDWCIKQYVHRQSIDCAARTRRLAHHSLGVARHRRRPLPARLR